MALKLREGKFNEEYSFFLSLTVTPLQVNPSNLFQLFPITPALPGCQSLYIYKFWQQHI